MSRDKAALIQQYFLILRINFKALKSKIKTGTNPIPDPNRYRSAVLTLLLGYRILYVTWKHHRKRYIELL